MQTKKSICRKLKHNIQLYMVVNIRMYFCRFYTIRLFSMQKSICICSRFSNVNGHEWKCKESLSGKYVMQKHNTRESNLKYFSIIISKLLNECYVYVMCVDVLLSIYDAISLEMTVFSVKSKQYNQEIKYYYWSWFYPINKQFFYDLSKRIL